MPGYRLADDLFFVALDDRNGHLQVHRDVVGSALAGTLLAELAADDWIEVLNERVQPTVEARRRLKVPLDALAHKVLEMVLSERERLPSREWIGFLALTAEQEVADRLVRANEISAERRRRALGKATVYTPADKNIAAWPRARLAEHWGRRRPMHEHDLILTGLCHASGLLHSVLNTAPPGTYELAAAESYRWIANRSVRALLDDLESTVTANASRLA